MRARREELGWSLEKLGVAIGLDESSARARISRYELGVHEPALETVEQLAQALSVPAAYLLCRDDRLANIIRVTSQLPPGDQDQLLSSVIARLTDHASTDVAP